MLASWDTISSLATGAAGSALLSPEVEAMQSQKKAEEKHVTVIELRATPICVYSSNLYYIITKSLNLLNILRFCLNRLVAGLKGTRDSCLSDELW